jgi:hypothetical protein
VDSGDHFQNEPIGEIPPLMSWFVRQVQELYRARGDEYLRAVIEQMRNPRVSSEIISNILFYHGKDISDIVNVMGFIFSKNEFERVFNISFDDYENLKSTKEYEDNYESELGNQHEKVDDRFDFTMDDVLDRISELGGYDKLSKEEKEFLKNYNK